VSAPSCDGDRGVGPPPHRLAVLGLGQMGGSLALAGRAAGLWAEVVGFGRRPESLQRALELGVCDRATTSAADAVSAADVVVLATPLRSIPTVVDAMAGALRPGTLVIDVGSVKGTAARDIEQRLPAGVAFVACHPLAGTERSGPEAASADLYRGRRCIVCPTPRTAPAALARAKDLWRRVGAEVVEMPAVLHDQVMAAVSHLPHVAAYALAAALADLTPDVDAAARGMATTSLRDTTRIAATDSRMWRDIFLENAEALLPLMDRLSAQVEELRQAVASGDGDRLVAALEAGRTARARLIG
jgi:prephenate dehydrogenase